MNLKALAAVVGVWSIPIMMGIAQYALLSAYWPQPFSFRATVIAQTCFWWFWAVATPVIFVAGRRFPLRRGAWLRSAPVHLLLAALITVAHTGVSYLATLAAGTFPKQETVASFLFNVLARLSSLDLVLYGIVLGAGIALDLRSAYARQQLRAATLETQVADARLRALRMQLNPHFLFNTLNSVAMLIRGKSNTEALRVVVSLSDLLRYVLATDKQEVSLGDEMAFLEEYLAIERVRFEDRLNVEVSAEPGTQFAAVPSLVLQPLVENAIRHGVERLPGERHIAVTARRVGEMLELVVRDNGPGLQETARGLGVGLQNTGARLRELYRDHADLTVTRESGWTVVRVVIPFRPSETAEQVTTS
jgi:two-component system LytT family sensor kinase